MSQISPPIRILLVCAAAFLVAWTMFLRPKDEAAQPPTPAPNVQTDDPAVSTPGQLVEAAQEAVDGAPATAPAAAKQPAQPPTAAGGAPKGAGLKNVPKPVARAIRKEKALVLLFWNGESADDRAVRSALRDVNTWNGRVHMHAAPLGKISDYGRITRGVDVAQSPTVVVVDPELRAETLVGYVDTQTIDQAVLDALRNTKGMFTSAYLREINSVCARFADSVWAIPHPSNGTEFAAYAAASRERWARFGRAFNGVAAPKRFRGLKRASMRDHAALGALYADWSAFLGANPSIARVGASVRRFGGRERTLQRRYERRMDAQNVLSCGRQA